MTSKKNIFIAGHKGMLGRSLFSILSKKKNIKLFFKTKKQLDLTNQAAVNNFFKKNNIHEVYIAAAKVGGIMANRDKPAEFIYQNIMIETNIINAAYNNNIKKLIFIGSSCIYPKLSKQPIKEEYLLSGFLEKTNEAYAVGKIAGIKLCESYNHQYQTDFRSVMLTNLYGPHDNFDEFSSHVIPGLIRKIHNAKIKKNKSVKIWGSGNAKREFLYINDAAEAIIKVMSLSKKKYYNSNNKKSFHLNIGSGKDITIYKLAKTISKIIKFNGDIVFDKKFPDGTPRKLLDSDKINKLGWFPKTDLEIGLKKTYIFFKNKYYNYV